MTKAEAIKELEDRGITVPADWSAKKVKDMLTQVKGVPTIDTYPQVDAVSRPAVRKWSPRG